MKQMSLGNNAFDLSPERTRKREFLDEMNRVVPWVDLTMLIEPQYPKGKTGSRDHKRHDAGAATWHVAMRPGKRRTRDRDRKWRALVDEIERTKASIRAKVEHPFRVIKRHFGFVKVRYRGLVKNTPQLTTLFALSSIWMARHRSMPTVGGSVHEARSSIAA